MPRPQTKMPPDVSWRKVKQWGLAGRSPPGAGGSYLAYAVSIRDADLLGTILDMRPWEDPFRKNGMGWSPIEHAKHKGYCELVDMMAKHKVRTDPYSYWDMLQQYAVIQ